MGKIRIIVLLAVILITGRASAYYKLVIDPWTTAAVTANAASQELIESQHNTRLDSISSKQQKIMQYTATIPLSRNSTNCRWKTLAASVRNPSIT